jgi:hypothetical protein
MNARHIFTPPDVIRNYRKLYVIAVEGDKTEPSYFRFFRDELDTVAIGIEIIPPESKSAPQHVLKKIQDYLKNPSPNGTSECWIVIDRDQWTVKTLDDVVKTCQENKIGLCVSNPAFEFWLLLHFENGAEIEPAEIHSDNRSAKTCKERLRDMQYLPRFSKNKLTNDQWVVLHSRLKDAIQHAKALDSPLCEDYPKQRIGSTVYRLVEKLIDG